MNAIRINIPICLFVIFLAAILSCKDSSSDDDDDNNIPVHTAVSISFTDTDLDGCEIGGTVNIIRAADESNITHYVLYWASDATTIMGSPITELAKTGADISYDLSNQLIPEGASHFLVLTKNNTGEMESGVSTPFTDEAGNCKIKVRMGDDSLDNFFFAFGTSLTNLILETGEINLGNNGYPPLGDPPGDLESGIYKLYAKSFPDPDYHELLINSTYSDYHFKYGEEYLIFYHTDYPNDCKIYIAIKNTP